MIELDEAANVYRKDGKSYPRLTDILKNAGIADYFDGPDRDFWLQRGSALHKATQFYDEGTLDESSLDGILRPYLDSWADFRAKDDFTPTEIERAYISDQYSFGCRIDRAGLYRGEMAIVEIKTTSIPRSTRIQTALQRVAMGDRNLIRIGVGLRKDGKFIKEIYTGSIDEGIGLSAVAIYHWKKNG